MKLVKYSKHRFVNINEIIIGPVASSTINSYTQRVDFADRDSIQIH